MDDSRLFTLFELYHKGTATPSETDELMQFLKDLPDEKLAEMLEKEWNSNKSEQPFFPSETREKFLSRLQPVEQAALSESHWVGKRQSLFVRIAAAAVILFAIAVTAILALKKEQAGMRDAVQNNPKESILKDFAPGGDKAILTLADGKQIVLDSVSNGAVAQQGSSKVIKIGGQLNYNTESNEARVFYNTITTPKGGQYQLELADGSKIWLNAASSLRFPVAFVGKERTVELTGEGYFEVAHNAKMPFHVKVGDMDVAVLGTHFNINSYSDEPSVKTTLLEGRVQVKEKGGNFIYLNPGQQAMLQPSQPGITVANDVDVEEVVAWKNGRFQYSSAGIETIMRQVARWYDVDIVYEKKTDETFSGGLPRSGKVSQLLRMLEATGRIAFAIDGKRIIVKPQ